MKALCFHGRGSNNEAASLRNDLPDFEFEFIQGAVPHTEALDPTFRENPWKLPHERILRWAAFINGATPLEIFRLSDVEARVGIVDDSAPERELKEIFLRPSNIRVRKENERHPGYDPEELRRNIMALETRQLADGRLFMTDGRMGGPRYEAAVQGSLIDIPTLHVQCPTVDNRHGGLELMKLCEPSLVREFFFHSHGHDFPRGHYEMKIAELIREVAEKL
ncbi:hypothetical protein CIRG_01481 [Coccidioides immitis RMSCC 2394]|uniref:Serine hydrolase FSH domain-containing protein n=1 Tax=Coccidioides immitis RMSCC 2394 TaxID=404692 RepID=A0A0J6Y0Z7_COCIT|nr:hypothetical protein CIRG_01481 [Coccidioides immitis RMSCC 2394]